MRWVVHLGDRVYPWLEHFANEHDLVARLGVLSPYRHRPRLIDIDGPVYVRTGDGSWGHVLNEHQLFAIAEHLEDRSVVANPCPAVRRGTPSVPRLYGYFGGLPGLEAS